MTKPKDPAGFPQTVLRDYRGRLIKGTAPLSTAGSRMTATLSFRALVRERFRDGEDGQMRMLAIVENLERMAAGHTQVNEKVQLGAATILFRLHDGKKAFDHDGTDGLRTIEATSNQAREYLSPEKVRENQEAIAAAMGCRVEEVREQLDAALAWRNAQQEIEG